MANERYSRLDNTAPVQSELDNSSVQVGRSAFKLNHMVAGQTLFGLLAPVALFETVPGQEFDINLVANLQLRNPSVRPLLNGCTVYFHAYYSDVTDLWEGAKNYFDTGRSGKIDLEKPHLVWSADSSDGKKSVNANTPLSLMSFFGLPTEVLQKTYDDNSSTAFPALRAFQPAVWTKSKASTAIVSVGKDCGNINALPFMMYQRVWRDFYANQNLLQNNKAWFPDNEDHFILSYNCTEACCVHYESENFDADEGLIYSNLIGQNYSVGVTPEPNNPATTTFNSQMKYRYPNLSAIKFRQFRGDRFISSLPFPDLIRGDLPTLGDLNSWVKAVVTSSSDSFYPVNTTVVLDGSYPPEFAANTELGFNTLTDSTTGDISHLGRFHLKSGETKSGSAKNIYFGLSADLSGITANSIYAMQVLTAFRERMARTKGTFNEMIKAQFGYSPNIHDRTPQYIGGYSQSFAFTGVTQVSQSSADSPLGTLAGQGSSRGNGRIGHFRANNYGYIMILMSVVPDTYYTQGVPKLFTRLYQSDEYFPLFNGLAPQPILNKELFVSGNKEIDEDVFAYQERYEEFKSMRNRVCGFSALSHTQSPYDSALVMQRRFKGTPNFNSQFTALIPENCDYDVFTFNTEPPFDFSIGVDCTTVAPMPYTCVPRKGNPTA